MELLHPGVYIQELSSGVKPIEGVSTSTGGFIGKAQKGPLNRAVLITRLSEFESTFGGFLDDSWLAHGVSQFFNNGGQRCYVVRVAGASARAAEISLRDRKSAPSRTLTARAITPGAWGNALDVAITNSQTDPDNEFNIAVFENRSGQTPPLPPLLLESFENLTMNPALPNFVERVVTAGGKYISVSADVANRATAVEGFSRGGRLAVGNGADVLKLGMANGGTEAPGVAGPSATHGRSASGTSPSINPDADKRRFTINLDGDGAKDVTVPAAATTGPQIAAGIQAAARALVANNPVRQAAYADFTCTFQTPPLPAQPFYELLSGTTGPASSVVVGNALFTNLAATLLGLGTSHGGVEAPGGALGGTSRSAANPAIDLPANARQININLDGDGVRTITIAPTAPTGFAIAQSIQSVVSGLTANTVANQPAYTTFTCSFQTPASPAQPFYLLTSGTTGATSTVVVTDTTPAASGISLPAGTRRFQINLNRDGPQVVSINGPLANGGAIAAAITSAVQALTPNRASNALAYSPSFICTYDNGGGARTPSFLLTSGAKGLNSSVEITNASLLAENAAGILRIGLTNGGSEVAGAAILRPANSQASTEYHLGVASTGGNVDGALLGDDGLPPGDLEHKTGLTALDTVRDINILAIPGVSTPDVVASGVNYCTLRGDCFFIGDVDSTDASVDAARAFINGLTVKSSYGAIYYPWLRAADPTGRSPVPILTPPSGAVMGLYARTDGRRGVWKAPAGTEANIGTAVGLAAETTDAQQDFLNPIGVNVLRSFPASGLVIWGARTLATRSDPEYRYIPVRRLAIFLEQSIYNGIQFAVFEPNDEPLWASLRLNISAFMGIQFRAGAFQGRSTSEAFFVRCDSSTTTQADIDAGIVNIVVGFAPLKPAEFVVLKLTQKTGQPV